MTTSKPLLKCRATIERIDRQGYDSTGYYWGAGMKLYRVEDDATGDTHHYRAHDRESAKRAHIRKFPTATFYR